MLALIQSRSWQADRHVRTGIALANKIVPSQMKEDRRGEAEGVESVQNAAMTANCGTPVFNSAITFDGRHHQSPSKTHQTNCEGHSGRLPRRKRRRPPWAMPQPPRAGSVSDDIFESSTFPSKPTYKPRRAGCCQTPDLQLDGCPLNPGANAARLASLNDDAPLRDRRPRKTIGASASRSPNISF